MIRSRKGRIRVMLSVFFPSLFCKFPRPGWGCFCETRSGFGRVGGFDPGEAAANPGLLDLTPLALIQMAMPNPLQPTLGLKTGRLQPRRLREVQVSVGFFGGI